MPLAVSFAPSQRMSRVGFATVPSTEIRFVVETSPVTTQVMPAAKTFTSFVTTSYAVHHAFVIFLPSQSR